MRQSKFRGFNVSENKWVFGSLVYSEQGRPFIVGCIVESNDEYCSLSFWYPVNPESVGEYTGLLDKNGKEICTSDLIRDDEGWLWEVSEGYDGFYLVSREKDLRPDSSIWNRVKFIEVLGNLYENPELLK